MKKFLTLFAVMVALCVGGSAQKKPIKKTGASAPSKKTAAVAPPAKKADEGNGSMFFITIESGGEKTEIAYTQFEEHGGQASMENEKSSHLMINYGASNYTNNDESFSFQGRLPAAAKGTFSQGEDGFNFSFQTTKFPKHQILLCESASYDITAMPQPEGIVAKPIKFVEGTFTCTGESYEDGSENKIQYTMTGRFKLPRIS